MGFANKNKFLVLLLQDFYHFNDAIWTIPTNWQSFVSKHKTAAVIVTHKDVKVIETSKDDNAIFVNLTTETGKLTIGSAYSKPKGDFRMDMKWLNFFVPLKHLILGADLNVHLSLLGYQKEDERGTLLTYL